MSKFRIGQKVSCTEGLPWFVGKIVHRHKVDHLIGDGPTHIYLIKEDRTGNLYARLEHEISTEGYTHGT